MYLKKNVCLELTCYTQFRLGDAEWGLKLKDFTDSGKNTPLHAAAECGNLIAVKILLQFNSDVYAKNCGGKLPIHLAAEQGHCKSVQSF